MLWYFNQVDSHTFTDDAMDVDVTIVVLALCKERQSVSTPKPSHYSFAISQTSVIHYHTSGRLGDNMRSYIFPVQETERAMNTQIH